MSHKYLNKNQIYSSLFSKNLQTDFCFRLHVIWYYGITCCIPIRRTTARPSIKKIFVQGIKYVKLKVYGSKRFYEQFHARFLRI